MMPAMFDLPWKTALLTGVAQGLGRAVGLPLARAGADLFLVDCNNHGARDTSARFANAGSAGVDAPIRSLKHVRSQIPNKPPLGAAVLPSVENIAQTVFDWREE